MLAFRYPHLLVDRLPRHVPLGIVTTTRLVLPLLKVVPAACAIALLACPLAFAAFIPATFESTKKSRLDRYVGELSYPVYLTNILVISLSRHWTSPTADQSRSLHP
jgi:peptidoglycan/LPS O-acetylase OafA/YrhL